MLEPRLLSRIEQKKAQLDLLRPLPGAAIARLRDQILVEWIYNSNAIEGSTITLQETRLILETGLTIGGKSLREHFEVINHRDAIDYVENLVASPEPITPFHVRQIHKLVLSRIDDENAGRYRETQVRIAGASFTPPESWQVPNLMTEWGEWLASEETTSHPVALAAHGAPSPGGDPPLYRRQWPHGQIGDEFDPDARRIPANRDPAHQPPAVLPCPRTGGCRKTDSPGQFCGQGGRTQFEPLSGSLHTGDSPAQT